MILTARHDTLLRLLARTPDDAWDRKDAALVARIERARWRDDAAYDCVEVDVWSRNASARTKAREFIQGRRFWRTGHI